MRYNWNKKDILNARNKVQIMMDNENDPEKRCYYASVIDTLNHYLFIKYDGFEYGHESNTDKTINRTASMLLNGRYVSIIYDFHYSLDAIYDDIEKTVEKRNKLQVVNPKAFEFRRYTHDECLNLVKTFYESFDKDLFKIFMRIFDQRYKSIKFIKHDDSSKGFDTTAFCYFVGGVD